MNTSYSRRLKKKRSWMSRLPKRRRLRLLRTRKLSIIKLKLA